MKRLVRILEVMWTYLQVLFPPLVIVAHVHELGVEIKRAGQKLGLRQKHAEWILICTSLMVVSVVVLRGIPSTVVYVGTALVVAGIIGWHPFILPMIVEFRKPVQLPDNVLQFKEVVQEKRKKVQ